MLNYFKTIQKKTHSVNRMRLKYNNKYIICYWNISLTRSKNDFSLLEGSGEK